MLTAACAGATDPGAEAPPADIPASSSTLAATSVPPGVAYPDSFGRTEIVIGGMTWTVAVADSARLRARGLMEVDDLGDLDGMLFVYDRDVTNSFTMEGTLMPIDSAFFTVDGELVTFLEMTPCLEASCPSWEATGPYRYAVETDHGGFEDLELVLEAPPID